MGLLSQTQQTYYGSGNSANYGDYQFVTLDSIINAFMVVYVGESKIISKVNRTDVQFHAMRGIQEFSYDIFKSVKAQEIEVPNTLKMILPQDYVNYTKITISGSDGIERVLYPTGKTSNPFAISQDANGAYQFTDGNLTEQDPTDKNSDTWTSFKSKNNDYDINTNNDYETDDDVLDAFGRRYGLDPQHAQQNGTFYIDERTGHIHFGSSLSGKTVVLHYISDGLGTDSEMVVHKFAEEAIYKWIAHGVIASRSNMPEYIVQRFKKERFAEARKAKIRLSNIKIEEFTQVLRGLSKPIK
tara:strand:+ start:96 stop:992 length:897 start_codon:yes stop_codon:yes gene_type:complete